MEFLFPFSRCLAQAHPDLAQCPVVHGRYPVPEYLRDAEPVTVVDMIVQHGRDKVMGGRDSVVVASEVERDILSRLYPCQARTGCPALCAEERADGRLAQAGKCLFPEGAEGIGKAYREGRLAGAFRRGGPDRE